MNWQNIIALLLVTVAFPVAAVEVKPVRITIAHTVNGQPLLLDSLRYELGNGERYSVSRLSYLLSEVAFETESGEWVSAGSGAGFIDLTKGLLRFDGQLPVQSYRAMRFSIGLAPELNHSDPATYPAKHALNPDYNHLHWTWADGYIFMALEGRYYNQDNQLSGFVYHFANDQNKVAVNIPLALAHSAGATIEINFDLGVLFEFPASLRTRDKISPTDLRSLVGAGCNSIRHEIHFG